MSQIEQALEHHKAGRLEQAEAIYRQILAQESDQPDALHLLGVVALEAGNHESAAALIKRAVEVKPDRPAYHIDLAQALWAQQKLEQAVASYQQAIALKPDLVEAHNGLGTVLQEQGELNKSIIAFRRALELAPDFTEARYNLGNVLHEAGELAEAVASYQRVLATKPDDVETWNNLGLVLKDQGKLSEAIDAFRQAQALRPDAASIHINLGLALDKEGNFDEAVHAYREALAVRPNDAKTNTRLGKALHRQDRVDEAAAAYRQALSLSPKYAEAQSALGKALAARGEVGQAVDAYRQALHNRPDLLGARLGLVSVLRFVNLPHYEPDLERELKKCLSCPQVDLQDLARPIANQLRHKYALVRMPTGTTTDTRALVTQWQADKLLLALLSKTVNVDPELELWLTLTRRWLLFEYIEAEQIPAASMELVVALGLQCFSNEYVLNETFDELKAVRQLVASCQRLIESNACPSPQLESQLLLLAMYRPIFTLSWAERLRVLAIDTWSPCVRPLIERVLIEPFEEMVIAENLPSFGNVEDPTSQAVRAHYEEHPYPRWLSMPSMKKVRLPDLLRRAFLHFVPPDFLDDEIQALVAGCGTGREPLSLAVGCKDLNVLAIDLSRRSLAYASRMADKLGIKNVHFAHGDILELSHLGRRFYVIECGGVLHHMAEPITGWRALTELLVPGGIMKIGLYSERARSDVIMARAQIANRGLSTDPRDIRAFREGAIAGDAADTLADLKDSNDFYTLSTCRDLLFHVQEHRFTLPDISKALDDLGLEFIGFDLPMPDMKKRFWELFPEDHRMTDLQAWDRFEQHNPSAFSGMYVFWCQKISSE